MLVLDAETLKKFVGYFVFVDYYSDRKKVFFFGELVEVIDGRLHIVSVNDLKEAYIDISEIINFKAKEVPEDG